MCATSSPVIRVGPEDGDIKGSDHAAIQKAIDSLPGTGGTVELLPGVYTCAN